MVGAILLAISILAVGFVVIVLFSPLQAALQFSLDATHAQGGFSGSFLHSRVLAMSIDFASKDVSVRLFGRSVGRKNEESAQSRDSSGLYENISTRHDAAAIPSPPAMEIVRPAATPSATEHVGQTNLDASIPSSSPVAFSEDGVVKQPEAVNSFPKRDDATGAASAAASTMQDAYSSKKENVAVAREKKDNWFKRLRQNRYVFFLGNNAWRNKVLRWVIRVVRAFFGIVRFDRFAVSVRAGVEDPMLTGTIAGFHRAAAGALAARHPFAISFEPVFLANHFECSGVVGVRTSALRLMLPLLIALVTFPTLRTLYLWWRYSRLEKRRSKEVVA